LQTKKEQFNRMNAFVFVRPREEEGEEEDKQQQP